VIGVLDCGMVGRVDDDMRKQIEGFNNFIQGIQNGGLKYQRDAFTPE
jgi:hypothetical protein